MLHRALTQSSGRRRSVSAERLSAAWKGRAKLTPTFAEPELPSAPGNSKAARRPRRKGQTILELGALLCLFGGAIGIAKAPSLQSSCDMMVCLGASIAVCTWVCYLYFQRE